MADDNKPNKPFFPEDSGFQSVERIGRRYAQPSSEDLVERQKLQTASETINGLEELLEERPELGKSGAIQKGIKSAREAIKRYAPRVSQRRDSRRERAIRETTTSVERDFSSRSINGQVADIGSQSNVQGRGLAMSGLSQKELEQNRSEILNNLGSAERDALDITQNELYDREGRQNPEALQKLRGLARRKQAQTHQLASTNVALKKQRQAGDDTASEDDSFLKAGKAAKGVLFKQNVTDTLQSGQGMGAMSNAQLKQQEIQQAQSLVEALEKLRNSVGKTDDEIEKMREGVKGTSDGLKETQEALKQRGNAGSGSGNFNNTADRLSSMLGILGGAAQEVGINQPLQAIANRTGFANQSNQLYGRRNSAISGDMTALLSASSEADAKMSETGKTFKTTTQFIRGAGALEGGIQLAAGGTQAINGIKNAAGTIGFTGGSDIAEGMERAMRGAATGIVNGADLINESSARSAQLAGSNSVMALNNTMNVIPGDFKQKLFDYSMGTRASSLGAGGSVGRKLMNQFAADDGSSGGLLGRMQNARIAPDRFAALQERSSSEQGSVFDSEQMFAARNMERSGNGTMEMNADRMSKLAGAGSNNPQTAFASVLESAFSKSLDSSKALNLVVDHTAEMARSSVGATMLGMDTTKAAASRLTSLVNQDNPNKEIAVNRAATAAGAIENINKSTGTNFSDMLTMTKMARVGNVDMLEARNLKNIDDPTAIALQDTLRDYDKMSPNEKSSQGGLKMRKDLEKSFYSIGAPNLIGKDGSVKIKEAQAMLTERGSSILNQGGIMNTVDKSTDEYARYSRGEISEEEMENNPKYAALRQQVSKSAPLVGLTGSELGRNIRANNGFEDKSPAGVNKARNALKGLGATQEQIFADNSATAAGADTANKARMAIERGGTAGSSIGSISRQQEKLVGGLNESTKEGFIGAASEAAKDFKESSGMFSSAVGKFSENIATLVNIPTSTSAKVLEELKPILDKFGKSGSSNAPPSVHGQYHHGRDKLGVQ